MRPHQRRPQRLLWQYRRADFEGLQAELLDVFDSSPDCEDDADVLWDRFRDRFLDAAKKYIPSRVTSCRRKLPWITHSVLRRMRRRDAAHRRAKRLATPEAWGWFRTARNRAVAAMRDARKQFLAALSRHREVLDDVQVCDK